MALLLIRAFQVLSFLLIASACATAGGIEKVTFNRLQDGLQLSGYISVPDTEGSHPAVVFLHGCSGIGISGSLSATYATWMRIFREAGFAVLAVDSATPRNFASTCGRSEKRGVMYRERPGDAYSALRYLQSRHDIQPDRIGLMGWSQGGGITLLTIVSQSIGRPHPATTPDFSAAVALYPSACSDAFQSKPYTQVEPNSWSTVAPLLVLHGEQDNWTPVTPCKEFIEAARARGEPVEMITYPGAAHSFDAPNLGLQRRTFPKLEDGSYPLIGTNEAARKDAISRVPAFFELHLGN